MNVRSWCMLLCATLMLLVGTAAFLPPSQVEVDFETITTVLRNAKSSAAEREKAALELARVATSSQISLLKDVLWQNDLTLRTRCAIAVKLHEVEVPEGIEFLLEQYDLYRLERRMSSRYTMDPVRESLQLLSSDSLLAALDQRLKSEREFRMQNNIRTLMDRIRLNQLPLDKLQEIAANTNWNTGQYRRYEAIEQIGRNGGPEMVAFLKSLKPWQTDQPGSERDVEGQNRVYFPRMVTAAIAAINARKPVAIVQPGSEKVPPSSLANSLAKPPVSKLTLPVEVRIFRGHHAPIRQIDVSPDGKYLLSVAHGDRRDGSETINEWIVWDVATGKIVHRGSDPQTKRHLDYEVTAALFLPDSRSVLSVGKDYKIWNCQTGETLKELDEDKRPFPIAGLSLSPNGKRAVGWWPGAAGQVAVWDLTTGAQRMVKVADARVATFLSNDRLLLTGGNSGNRVRTFDLETDTLGEFFNGEGSTIYGLRVSPDGLVAATTANVEIWDVVGKRYRVSTDRGSCVRFAPDNQHMLIGRMEGDVSIVHRDTGNPRLNFEAQRDAIRDVAYLPDGKHILTAGGGGFPPYANEANADYAIRCWRIPDATSKR